MQSTALPPLQLFESTAGHEGWFARAGNSILVDAIRRGNPAGNDIALAKLFWYGPASRVADSSQEGKIMYGRIILVAALAAGFAASAFGQRANPEPTKKHPYEIAPAAGPWAICVTCFFDNVDSTDYDPNRPRTGLARSLAIDFVTELRSKYQMQGYMFNRGDDERKKEEERIEKEHQELVELYRKLGKPLPEKVFRKRYAHVQDQYMVLIGGFQDQDAARKYLDLLRKQDPPSKQFLNKMQLDYRKPAGTRGGDIGLVSPFATAFVVPNPTVPVQKQQITAEEAAELDWTRFNSHNPYNLLKHPGKWTLVVKAYRSPVQQWGLEKQSVLQRGPNDANAARVLEAIGKQAEQLAAVLRCPQLKFDAYVMHANSFSLVTVGLFDSPNDPRMARMSESLSKLHLDPETLITPPQPMAVPRKR